MSYCLKLLTWVTYKIAHVCHKKFSVKAGQIIVENCKMHIKFNVFHVRALYYTKNFKHQQMHKEFILVNYNSLPHVWTLLGHLQGETFRCRYTMLHYTV
jgi:hypothetical protein